MSVRPICVVVASGLLGAATVPLAETAGLEKARALKAERATASASAETSSAKRSKTVTVDCAKGQKIQSAIDANAGPLLIEVRGICQENVLLEGKTVTLHGLDPAADGIQGVAASPAAPAALDIRFASDSVVENLSISNGPGNGARIEHSNNVTMQNCRLEGNAATGLVVVGSSLWSGLEVTLSTNGGHGLLATRGGAAFCTGCVVANNAGRAAAATNGGILSLLDSTVTGARGLLASLGGSYADIDCVTSATSYPCSLNVSGLAGQALAEGTVAMYGAGDFTGRLSASDRAHVYVLGARQLASGGANIVSQFATLTAEPFDDGSGPVQSEVRATQVSAFGRVLLADQTVLAGNLTCQSAGDAWLDSGVVTGGNTVSGCASYVP